MASGAYYDPDNPVDYSHSASVVGEKSGGPADGQRSGGVAVEPHRVQASLLSSFSTDGADAIDVALMSAMRKAIGGINRTPLPDVDAGPAGGSTNPQHYQYGDGIQAIDIIRMIFSANAQALPAFQACLLYNVFKYCLRFWRKGGVVDLHKAQQYLKWLVEEIETGKITHA